MTGPGRGAGRELSYGDDELYTEDVRQFRVLSVMPDEKGGWDVDLGLEDVDDEVDPPADLSKVRLCVIDEDGKSVSPDLPDEVLQRIAEKIRQL